MYKVYIVEDEHLEREALKMILDKQAPNVKVVGSAATGTAAMEGIDETEPDIVLMDINIPEINGIEVLRRVKKKDPAKKVILITAFNEFDFAHQAIKAKVDDFLLKPIRPEQLLEAVGQAITSLKANEISLFTEKMNEVIYAIVQKKYAVCRKALGEYLDLLYDHYGYDLLAIENEVDHFLSEIYAIEVNEAKENNQPAPPQPTSAHLTGHFKNRYNLKIEIMKVIDRIFERTVSENSNRKNTIDDILNYIDMNCHKDISLDQVGEYANMSSYYLSKIFKKETGVNFVTYLTNRKIDIAKDMLVNTDVPIINIALDLSYHEPNYFSKVFKKSTGMTPTEYRKRYKNRKKPFDSDF